MGLKILDNRHYVRLINDLDVNFEIYESEEARIRFKSATASTIILQKYEELIAEQEQLISKYLSDNEIPKEELNKLCKTYKPLKKYFMQLDKLHKEYVTYKYELQLEKGAKSSFTIMKKYYSDVANSIPYIVQKGFTMLGDKKRPKVDALYNEAKKVARFGDTEDC